MVQVVSSMDDIRTSCYAARLAAFSYPQKRWKAHIFRGAQVPLIKIIANIFAIHKPELCCKSFSSESHDFIYDLSRKTRSFAASAHPISSGYNRE